MKDKVVITEIWRKCDKDKSEVSVFGEEYGLERIALLANGHPIFLKEDFMLEKRYMSKEEYDNLTTPSCDNDVMK